MSTRENTAGEIESLFVEEAFRKSGLGGQFIENSVKWLKENNRTRISVAVAEGHESVCGFYEKYGFYPRMTNLELQE